MKKKSVLRMSMVAVPAIIICGLLVAASSARVGRGAGRDDEHTKACSNNTLQGDYGFAVQGEILGPGIQFRGVVMQHYDGRGNITQVDHIVQNGMPPATEWRPGTGTYSVNPNCTGSAVLIVPGDPGSPINLHFVVVNQGKEIHQVVDSNAVTAVGIKVDNDRDLPVSDRR
jgi:hypothetical protein